MGEFSVIRMRQIVGFITVVAGAMLVGCDQVKALGSSLSDEPVTVVISPGYAVAIDAKPVSVFGFDACPKPDPATSEYLGLAPKDGEANCVVVTPQTKSVRVGLATATGLVVEQWTIYRDEKHPGHVYLKRANGALVVSGG